MSCKSFWSKYRQFSLLYGQLIVKVDAIVVVISQHRQLSPQYHPWLLWLEVIFLALVQSPAQQECLDIMVEMHSEIIGRKRSSVITCEVSEVESFVNIFPVW